MTGRSDPGRIAIFGASGTGKTTLMNELIKPDDRVIGFDPVRSMAGRAFDDRRAFIRAIMAAKGGPFRLIYRAPRGSNREAELIWLSDFVLNFQTDYYRGKSKRPLTFAVDEMSLCYPNKYQPSGDHPFTELCNTGRHYGVRLIGSTQRPAEIGPTFRGNPQAIYAFRLASEVDIERVRKLMGLRDGDELKRLAVGECFRLESGKLSRLKVKKSA
ncbi:MAG: hypothetical protein RLO08_00335 [Parvibaculaceae bacterium]